MGSSSWEEVKSHLPGKQLVKLYIIAFINLFAQAFCITMLFPFLPFMVKFLVPNVKDTAVGRYVGVVSGSLFVGRIFGSYVWGVVADKKGRKPVLVWSGILTSIFVLAFGFSINLPMAVITRFLVGFFNGTVTSCKAMISEASTDRFQAFGLSIIGASWSLGFILGPAVSGAIADPVGQYNLTISNSFLHGYFTKFPYSLPCIINALLFIIGVFPVAFCLPETLGKKRNLKRSEINQKELELLDKHQEGGKMSNMEINDVNDDYAKELDVDDRTRLLEEAYDVEEAETSLTIGVPTENVVISNPLETLSDNSEDHQTGSIDEQSNGSRSADICMIEVGGVKGGVEDGISRQQVTAERKRLSKLKSLQQSLNESVRSSLSDVALFMCHKSTLIPLVLYMVFSFAIIGYNEILTLWAFTQPQYGGLGFSLHEIGIVLMIVGVFLFPVNLFAFAILEKYLKSIKVFYIGATVLVFTILMLPHLHHLANASSPWLLWILLIAIVFVLSASSALLFSAVFIFINNSVTFDKLGSINGLAMTLVSLTRCVSPVLFGLFFSLTLSETTLKIGFPLDYNFVFVMFSVIYLSCVFLVASLPELINYQKIIEDV